MLGDAAGELGTVQIIRVIIRAEKDEQVAVAARHVHGPDALLEGFLVAGQLLVLLPDLLLLRRDLGGQAVDLLVAGRDLLLGVGDLPLELLLELFLLGLILLERVDVLLDLLLGLLEVAQLIGVIRHVFVIGRSRVGNHAGRLKTDRTGQHQAAGDNRQFRNLTITHGIRSLLCANTC